MKSILVFLAALFTMIVGHHIHGSIFWAILNFFFWPIAWIKWSICHEVSVGVISEAFSFFLN